MSLSVHNKKRPLGRLLFNKMASHQLIGIATAPVANKQSEPTITTKKKNMIEMRKRWKGVMPKNPLDSRANSDFGLSSSSSRKLVVSSSLRKSSSILASLN